MRTQMLDEEGGEWRNPYPSFPQIGTSTLILRLIKDYVSVCEGEGERAPTKWSTNYIKLRWQM